MSAVSEASEALGFVASPTSWCDELAAAAEHCARIGQRLVVSSVNSAEEALALNQRYPGLEMVLDGRGWASANATPEMPTAISDQLFDVATWTDMELSRSQARWILNPVLFTRLGDHASLRAQLDMVRSADHAQLIAHVATDADVLRAKNLPAFLDVLAASQLSRFAFQFAHKSQPLGQYDRLNGLRQLLARFPGSWVVGADVPAATDAMAHGAGWVGIGASSGRRLERRPGDKGGGSYSSDYLPGTWMRPLMEMRSPSTYADWYANSPMPTCRHCHRSLESYQPTASDKTLLIGHNLHGITEFAVELMTAPESERAAWLNNERVDAFLRHGKLTSTGARVSADLTLRRLCELDDPQLRETRPTGAWK